MKDFMNRWHCRMLGHKLVRIGSGWQLCKTFRCERCGKVITPDMRWYSGWKKRMEELEGISVASSDEA